MNSAAASTALAPMDIDRKLELIERGKFALAEAKTVPEIKHIRDVAATVEMFQRQRDASIEAQNDAAELRLRAERRLGEVLAEMEKHPPGPEAKEIGNTVLPISDRQLFACPLCVEEFSEQVWHCPGCAHHWLMDRAECWNCHKGKQKKAYASKPVPSERPPRLADLGIAKMQSSRWQQQAAIPEPVFEEYVEETRAADEPLTTSGLLKKVAKAQASADERLIADAIENNPVHAEAIRLADLAKRWSNVHVWIREHVFPINPTLIAQAIPREQAFLDDQLADELADWFGRLRDARMGRPTLVAMNGRTAT